MGILNIEINAIFFPVLKKSISLNTELPNQIGHLSLPRKQGLCHHAVHPSINFFSIFTSLFLPISVKFEKGTEVSPWLQKLEWN